MFKVYVRVALLLAGAGLYTLYSGVMGCSGPEIGTTGFYPETCADIQDAAIDESGDGPSNGSYTLYVDGDEALPWDAYCYNMNRAEPLEYLTVDELENYSEISVNDSVITTSYRRYRIDPINLTINPLDTTFAETEISGDLEPVFPIDGVDHVPAGFAEVQLTSSGDFEASSKANISDTQFVFDEEIVEHEITQFFCQVDSTGVLEDWTSASTIEVNEEATIFNFTIVNTNAGNLTSATSRIVADCDHLSGEISDEDEGEWPLRYGDSSGPAGDDTETDTSTSTSIFTVTSLTAPTESGMIAGLIEDFDEGFIPGNIINDSIVIENDEGYCENENGFLVAVEDFNVEYALADLPDWLEDGSGMEGFAITADEPITIPEDVLDPILISASCTSQTDTSITATREDIMLNDYDGDNRTDYFEYLHAFEYISKNGTIAVANPAAPVFIGSLATPHVANALVGAFSGLDFQTNEDSEEDDFDGDGMTNAEEFEDGSNMFIASGAGSFAINDSETSPSLPEDLATIDLEGDGDLDVAQTSFSENKVALYVNDGTGGFGNRTDVTVGTTPWGIIAADLNEDGDMDLVTANSGSDNLSILINSGTGSFTATTVSVGDSPAQMVAGDFNEDGNIDIAVTNFGNSSDGTTISILLGNGSGGLTLNNNTTVGTGPNHIATADFDEDGTLDLVVTNRGSNGDGTTASILLGDGDGTFTAGTALTTQAGPAGVAVADFDGDDDIDIVIANNHHDDGTVVGVYLGNGDGTFGAATALGNVFGPYDILAFDSDGDNDIDLLVSDATGKVIVFGNNGAATFSKVGEVTIGAATYENFMSPGDFDADGKIDFVASDFGGALMKFIMND